jgi:hypothetical protein
MPEVRRNCNGSSSYVVARFESESGVVLSEAAFQDVAKALPAQASVCCEIPCPADENAGLRNDAAGKGSRHVTSIFVSGDGLLLGRSFRFG